MPAPIPIQDTNQAHFNVNAPLVRRLRLTCRSHVRALIPGFGMRGRGLRALLCHTLSRGARTRLRRLLFIAAGFDRSIRARSHSRWRQRTDRRPPPRPRNPAGGDGPWKKPRPLASKPPGPQDAPGLTLRSLAPLPLPQRVQVAEPGRRPAVGTCSPRGASRKTAAWDAGWRARHVFSSATCWTRGPSGRGAGGV